MPHTDICVHLCVLKSMFAHKFVHVGVQLDASQASDQGRFGRQREIRTKTEEGLTGDSKLMQTLDRGVIIHSRSGLKLKGHSVKWWKRLSPYFFH